MNNEKPGTWFIPYYTICRTHKGANITIEGGSTGNHPVYSLIPHNQGEVVCGIAILPLGPPNRKLYQHEPL